MKQLFLYRKKQLLLHLLITIVLSVLMVINAIVIERIASVTKMNELLIVTIGAIIFLVIQSLSYFFQQYYTERLVQVLMDDIRLVIFRDLKNKPGFMISQKIQDQYLSTLTSKLNIIEQSFLVQLFWGIYLISQFFVALILAMKINLLLSFFVLVLTIPQILVPIFSRKSLTKNKQEVSKIIDLYVAEVDDYLVGSETWRIFNKRDTFFKKLQLVSNKVKDTEIKEAKTLNIVGVLNKIFSDFLYFGTWLLGAYFIISGQLTLSLLVGFTQIVSSISFPLNSATGTMSEIIGGFEVFKEVIVSSGTSLYTEPIFTLNDNAVSFVDVDYHVGKKVILQKFTYDFKSQKRYLVIGESGSGKTSLFRLIFNEASPINGEVMRSEKVAYVPQEPHIFKGTLIENITLFSIDICEEHLNSIIKMLYLEPLKDMKLSSKTVSGGEKSRIALARALYSQAEFLVVDELSSALDKETQREIEQMLLNSDLNFIYATHKYDEAFVSNFDQIIEMPILTEIIE